MTSACYTVHVGHGLLDAPAVATHSTRAAARADATARVRQGARMVEVRKRWHLLDQYVLRGSSPRHITDWRERASTDKGALPL